MESEGQREGGDHGGNLAPGVDAPPIPAKHVNTAGAGADLEDNLPAGANGFKLRGNVAGGDDQQNGHELGNLDVVAFRSMANEEAAVKIFDDVGSAPIELSGDGGHEGGEKAGHDDSAQGVRDVIVDDHHVAGFGMLQARIQNDRGERSENPGPGAQRVVCDVEPENGK